MGVEGYVVAVVGATGAVGREMLEQLAASEVPVREVRAFASPRSAGRELPYADGTVTVEALTEGCFRGIDLALFSAGGGRSKEWAPRAVAEGCVVVDNSSAWRMDDTVPLVVPEVNDEALLRHRGIIANPNCSTIQMVLPLQAIAQHVGIERVVVATYQSASGAGQAGIDELFEGTRAALAGEPVPAETFARPLAFDSIPHIGDFTESGYTTEELKMLHETRKIMGQPTMAVSATCVRVPVPRVHLEAVTVDLAEATPVAKIREWFEGFPGLVVLDEPAEGRYPVARDAEGRTETFVGRLREDSVLPATCHFWVVSDNLLKGAASNAVQIAESLHRRELVRVA